MLIAAFPPGSMKSPRQLVPPSLMDTPTPAPHIPSIPIIGWSTIIASALMILVNISSLLTTSALDALNMSFDSPVFAQYIPQSMKSMLDLYTYSRWWTWYGVLYFAFVLAAGVQFVRLRAWGRSALEAACWIGLMNALVDTILSYEIWSSMQEAYNVVLRSMGGVHSTYLNPLGFFTIVLGFFLWVIPAVALIVYLRRPVIRQTISVP
ncbi:MAG TPA: hypothetical protein DEP53_11140 [Bacteroidetes bacterium]|nr:MAG: hypothetical protein A2X66_01285 [Ignavibacteria bacterium GWA2_54_16]HCA80274.1 hypothetical protein [Bacteroidota bacterium]